MYWYVYLEQRMEMERVKSYTYLLLSIIKAHTEIIQL